MNIAVIVPEFPALSQTFVLNQITGLIDQGHRIEIFADRKKDEKHHPDVTKYDLLTRTTYLSKSPSGRVRKIRKGVMLTLKHIWKYPKTIFKSLNIVEFGKEAANFTVLTNIASFLGKGPFDVIFCHFGPSGIKGLHCLRTGAATGKLVTVFHGYDLTAYPKKHGMHVYDVLFKYCDLCLPISDHWKNRLIDMKCDPSKVMVHRMGVDLNRFCGVERMRRKGEKIKILSVARLVEKKGLEFGIMAVSRVMQHFDNIEYMIAGDGLLRPQLERMIHQLKLEDTVQLLGWQNQDEVSDLMKQADILLTPSITGESGDQEGIPVVLMEALAMEVPVVSTFHSGIPELIIDGKTGLLAPERDDVILAKKLMLLIRNTSLADDIRCNGKDFVKKHHSIDTLNRTLSNLFSQLISG